MRNKARLTPQFRGEEHHVPLSGVNLNHFKERKKKPPWGSMVAFPYQACSCLSPSTLLTLGWEDGRDRKQKKRGREEEVFCSDGLALARRGK